MIKNFITTCIVTLFLSAIAGIALASTEGTCGESVFLIKKNNLLSDKPKFELYYKTTGNEEKLLYPVHADWVDVMCVKDNNMHPYVLLQERCSGSACTDEGQFRIFDPYTKKIIIDKQPMTPEDRDGTEDVDDIMASKISLANHDVRNQKLVERFLGTPLPIVRKSKDKFCCDKAFNSLY